MNGPSEASHLLRMARKDPQATRADYYDGLRQVTERDDWETWMRSFLNSVARQSEDALSRAKRINGLLQEQGIVAPATEAKRHRLFCAKALLDILKEPARISAAFKT